MKRMGILTAGGDTPAINSTVFGAVTRANQLGIELVGLLRGYESLFDDRVPHVILNPLFRTIPELDPEYGGSILGSSRKFVDASNKRELDRIQQRLQRLRVEGLICVGGDGTLNGLQPFSERIPVVLAPKTIDNDLGLNYPNENDKWVREPVKSNGSEYRYRENQAFVQKSMNHFQLDQMVNYVTPGYATAVFVAVGGIRRLRTTAESHRRIGIIEVMGRSSGFIALACAYGQPDLILVPEVPVDINQVVERVKEIYRLQKNVLIVVGEGIVDPDGNVLGASERSTDPAGNIRLSGAADRLREMLLSRLGASFFSDLGFQDGADSAIFTRKVGHTQRGGRPVGFDRFYAAQLGGRAVEMLVEGQNNAVSVLQWHSSRGFYVSSHPGNGFRDQWGLIHARSLHPSFFDADRLHISSVGIDYLLPIFTTCIGPEDVLFIRETRFDSGNLFRRYHSVNTDIEKRTRYVE
ncbi:MAG TPA: 6-phosphofructokinase [Pirellulaceae bacterium]|nr:6-phosphofructokinase [Pirellulaceae bacterium]